jgi:hypothetical protein
MFEALAGALRLSDLRKTTRQEIPKPHSRRMLQGANLEIKQLCTYMCSIGTKLYKAIGGKNVDVIKSYRRALKSRVVRIQEAATREADARCWNLDVLEVMMQEVDGSTCHLLRDMDRVLQDLAEEARTNWEERVAY